MVVNIHAAHQRILFEELLANLKSEKVRQQQLLMPVTLELAPDEARLLSRQLDAFKSLGYTIEPFGGNAYLVTAVPANVRDDNLCDAMRDILSDLRRETVTNRQSATHLAQTAARHAVREGDLQGLRRGIEAALDRKKGQDLAILGQSRVGFRLGFRLGGGQDGLQVGIGFDGLAVFAASGREREREEEKHEEEETNRTFHGKTSCVSADHSTAMTGGSSGIASTGMSAIDQVFRRAT